MIAMLTLDMNNEWHYFVYTSNTLQEEQMSYNITIMLSP